MSSGWRFVIILSMGDGPQNPDSEVLYQSSPEREDYFLCPAPSKNGEERVFLPRMILVDNPGRNKKLADIPSPKDIDPKLKNSEYSIAQGSRYAVNKKLIEDILNNKTEPAEISEGGLGFVIPGEDLLQEVTLPAGTDRETPLHFPAAAIAVKMLNDHKPQVKQEFIRQFFKEARLLGHLSNPGLPRLYDLTLIPSARGTIPAIIMEYFAKGTLADVVDKTQGKGIPIEDTIHILNECASVLDYLHAQGISHNDFTLSNVMFRNDGQVVVTDLGSATRLQKSSPGIDGPLNTPALENQTGNITYQYAAPEVINRKKTTQFSDQYSLAMVAGELLGILFYTGNIDNPKDVANYHRFINTILETPRSLNDPKALVLKKALDKDPSRRYSSCKEFVKALEVATTAESSARGES